MLPADEQMKTALRAVRGGSAELGSADVAAVGCAAGVLTAALTTPLDVVKTRLMSQGAARTYAGIGDCLRQTVAQEGVGALFKGVQPRVLWIGLGGAIFFPVLEAAKAALLPLADKC